MHLSKSQYLRGLQCHKALWLYKHRREVMAEFDQATLHRFRTGIEAGKLAQGIFPGGTEVDYAEGDFNAMIETTDTLVRQGERVIYEGTFRHNGVLIRADILVRHGDVWDLYEVKSSTRVKPEHKHDAAIQWYVLSRRLPLGRVCIVHIDTGYTRTGELDLHGLFAIVEITDDVLDLQPGIEASLARMTTTLEGDEPDIPIGPYCTTPYPCDFKEYCWRDVPRPSVFDLHNLHGDRKFELYRSGKISYADLQDIRLNDTQAMQIRSALSGEPHIDTRRIAEFIERAEYPIHFLDFETFSSAIPRLEGQRPYTSAIPFQYSLHILWPDGNLEHREFLGDGRSDPRAALAEQLVADINDTGTIVAYSQSTEKSIIGRLANEYEARREELISLNQRFIDLIVPFRQLMYYHPDFNGSFSIKTVLPTLFPDDPSLSYQGLDIQQGELAGAAYARLAETDDENEIREIRESLLAYCRLDTLGMVMIWRKLADLVR